MVVGNPYLRSYDASKPEQRAISHHCLRDAPSGVPGQPWYDETPHLPARPCKRLRAQTFFPSCWDGRNLDSPDHKSHMAFPALGSHQDGVCPESHPVAVLSVFLEFFYDTGAIKHFNHLVWAMCDPTGYGLHGDYIQGWTNQTAFKCAMQTCTGRDGVNAEHCSLNVGPRGPGHADLQSSTVPPPPEEVGLRGPLVRLPGDNPVVGDTVRRSRGNGFG